MSTSNEVGAAKDQPTNGGLSGKSSKSRVNGATKLPAEPRAAVMAREDRHKYFMGIAMAVRLRANCKGNRVGAVIAIDNQIVSTGYNGTPENMPNCLDGGCHRCANRGKTYKSGEAYDLCICVHAEQNAILAAARFGIATEGTTMYTTMRPCFGCAKEMLQAHVHAVYYLHEWTPNAKEDQLKTAEERGEYEKLLLRFPGGLHALKMPDSLQTWAVSNKRSAVITPDRGLHQDIQ
ncbi:MAG: dCMP deaminase family protein [Candidatus Sulfotelmatobacter sp.]